MPLFSICIRENPNAFTSMLQGLGITSTSARLIFLRISLIWRNISFLPIWKIPPDKIKTLRFRSLGGKVSA